MSVLKKEKAIERLLSLEDDAKYGVNMDTYLNYSKDKVEITCNRCNSIYHMTLKNFVLGQRCKKCSYSDRALKLTVKPDNEMISKLNSKNMKIVKFNGKSKINQYQCNNCNHEFSSSIKLATSNKFNCPKCYVDDNEKLKHRVAKYQDRLDLLSINVTINPNKFNGVIKLSNFTCNECNNLFNGYYNNMIVGNKSTCPFCPSREGSFDIGYYNSLLSDDYNIQGDSHLLIKNTDTVTVKHLTCGSTFNKTLSDLIHNKQYCPTCSSNNRSKKSHKEIEDEISKLGFTICEEFHNTRSHVNIRCNRCNYTEKVMIKYILDGRSCIKCSNHISKGERKIIDYLTDRNIEFIFQKSISTKAKSFQRIDFFLEDLSLAIEYDGIQHFEPVDFFGGDKYLDYVMLNDRYKNEYCEANGIELLRIKYTDIDNIDTIIDGKLDEMKVSRPVWTGGKD